jgi:hypothetical protein
MCTVCGIRAVANVLCSHATTAGANTRVIGPGCSACQLQNVLRLLGAACCQLSPTGSASAASMSSSVCKWTSVISGANTRGIGPGCSACGSKASCKTFCACWEQHAASYHRRAKHPLVVCLLGQPVQLRLQVDFRDLGFASTAIETHNKNLIILNQILSQSTKIIYYNQ